MKTERTKNTNKKKAPVCKQLAKELDGNRYEFKLFKSNSFTGAEGDCTNEKRFKR